MLQAENTIKRYIEHGEIIKISANNNIQHQYLESVNNIHTNNALNHIEVVVSSFVEQVQNEYKTNYINNGTLPNGFTVCITGLYYKTQAHK